MATIKIIRRDKPNSQGYYPVTLRIIKNRKIKYISLGITCFEKDWNSSNSEFKKSFKDYVQYNMTLNKYREKALKIINAFSLEDVDFTLTQFESRFRGQRDANTTVRDFWLEKINDLNTAGRTGNARAHRDTLNSFFKFIKNTQFKFRDINVECLEKYETHLRSTGSMDGGIGVRMRELRALFNDAIKKGLIDEKYYPFKIYKISKLKGKGVKKALTRTDISKIAELDESIYPHLSESKKLFIFSYFTRGMNFYDMMKLKWSNIEDNYIIYTRSKTKGNFKIEILEPVRKILDEYKNQGRITDYVFPILLHQNLTPIQIENKKAKKLKKFNSDLKKIAEVLEINKKVTSYVARHSYATNLKELGISIEKISESMGHQNVGITSAYLKDFDSDTIDEANRKLLFEPKIAYYRKSNLRLAEM